MVSSIYTGSSDHLHTIITEHSMISYLPEIRQQSKYEQCLQAHHEKVAKVVLSDVTSVFFHL